jgi:hypothetical protein
MDFLKKSGAAPDVADVQIKKDATVITEHVSELIAKKLF